MALTQRTFRIRTDAGAVDATPTWGAAQDVNFWPGLETAFRVRFSVNNTTPSASGPFILRLSKNGGAYNAITTSSTDGIQSADASSSTDEAVIATANIRLGAGTGTVATGVYDETGSATKTMATNTYNEFEYGLIIKTANVASGNTLDLRIYNSTTAFGTYTQTPRFTVPAALLANDVASASSVGRPSLNAVYAPLHRIEMGVRAPLHPVRAGIHGRAFDAASLAIFAAFTTPPTSARKALIDDVVASLKGAGIWTKLDVLYAFAAADSQAALINWKAPGTYNGTAVNSPSFTADQGFTGGAGPKYIDTSFNATTVSTPNYAQNSASFFAWSLKAGQDSGSLFGYGVSNNIQLFSRFTDDRTYTNLNDAFNSFVASTTDGSGLFVATRTGASAVSVYRNGTSIGTQSAASAALINENFYFLFRTANPFTGQEAAGGFGSQLSAADNTALYNALRTYMTGVGVP